MHATLVRGTSRVLAVAVAAGIAGTLAWTPAHAAPQADTFGPGFSIPDSQNNPGTSHIGAYGPPGQKVWGDSETYCADPDRKGPAEAGHYSAPKAVTSWTSSVTGKTVPTANLAYASYVIGRYGQTHDAAQAAAVDATVYEWLAGGTYAINGQRGTQRLTYPVVSPTSRTLALRYITEAKRYAGPYALHITPSVKTTHTGQKVTVAVKVTSTLTGATIPGVSVTLAESGTGPETATGRVTTDEDGTAAWQFTADATGKATVKASATGLPGTQLKVLTPQNTAAQRMLLAGDTTTAENSATIAVEEAPGGVEIHKKDPAGDTITGAAFQLLDTKTSTVVAAGTTNAQGVLVLDGIAPGVYRLRETSTGDTVHALVPDQDVTITAGRTAHANPLTVIDPYRQADLLVRKTDKTTGKPLPGAVINISEDIAAPSGKHRPGKQILSLTTGKDGTATTKLDVTLKAGTHYWATETKAPSGYQLDSELAEFTAKPGTAVTVTLTDTATPPSTPPPAPPTTPPPATPPTAAHTPDTPPPSGSLAHTGADATPWLLGGAGLLLAAGGSAVIATRRRRSADGHGDS
ncbi:MSCRAMM family protein [Streptomyces celluloflavus]|uniref:MSCRAMM family protein n=1 Tax=Streptomyces celluloflavus TaxID=58344 RepID=UPI00346163A5|nr:SpaA isopeptide-forming pilin-related protein [Streptomyces celluloflavus]